MRGLFEPKSIAIVGATPKKGKVGNILLNNIKKSFKKDIYPINPSYDKILGINCFNSVLDAPKADLAVIVVPAASVVDVVEECGQKGIKSVVVISAGFSETGRRGAHLELDLIEKSKKYGINLVGPNCLGIMNTHKGLNATFSKSIPSRGDIAFLSQSGAFILAVMDWAKSRNIGFSKVVSLGNKAILDEIKFLECLEKDNQTKVIILYIEGIKNGNEFIKVAKRVSKVKPIVVMKSGRTESGAKAASSHTGSLAGSYRAFQAAFRQSRVIEAYSVEELFDFSRILSSIQELKGRVGIVTNSGGPGVMAADAIESNNLQLAGYSRETLKKLKELLPSESNVYNPVDILGDSDSDRFGKTAKIVSEDADVGAILAILTPTAQIDFDKAADYLIGLEKPVVTCFMVGSSGKSAVERLEKSGIVNFFDPIRAVKSLSAVKIFESSRNMSHPEPERLAVNKDAAEKVIKQVKERRAKIVGSDALKILEAYDIKVIPYGLARTADEAEKIAREIGYPVAMKVVSPHIVHKSDVGCVKINVQEDKVRKTFFDIIMMAEQISNRIDGVLVQKMVQGGKEIIIGMKRDPQFGPLIMFGMGGIYVEIFKDVSFRIAPINRDDAIEMIKSIKAYHVLKGARGEAGLDIDSLIEILLKISQLSIDIPEIIEMDINPVVVFEKGYYAVDFRIITG